MPDYMPDKKAVTDYLIHELLAKRWSPHALADRPVSKTDLLSLFEAARWAPSSYNEQPWSYIVATKEDSTQFPQILSCLVEGNQAWAKAAPVLALAIVSLKFAHNAKDNRAAVHDLGLASGNLVMEATARGLSVHQMIGILPDKAREIYQIPDAWEASTGLAIRISGRSHEAPGQPQRARSYAEATQASEPVRICRKVGKSLGACSEEVAFWRYLLVRAEAGDISRSATRLRTVDGF